MKLLDHYLRLQLLTKVLLGFASVRLRFGLLEVVAPTDFLKFGHLPRFVLDLLDRGLLVFVSARGVLRCARLGPALGSLRHDLPIQVFTGTHSVVIDNFPVRGEQGLGRSEAVPPRRVRDC